LEALIALKQAHSANDFVKNEAQNTHCQCTLIEQFNILRDV
jgi:hypothetical protein